MARFCPLSTDPGGIPAYLYNVQRLAGCRAHYFTGHLGVNTPEKEVNRATLPLEMLSILFGRRLRISRTNRRTLRKQQADTHTRNLRKHCSMRLPRVMSPLITSLFNSESKRQLFLGQGSGLPHYSATGSPCNHRRREFCGIEQSFGKKK
jgi:hypothetical protein